MGLLLWLIGAHYIGDIALQSDWVANMKRERWYIMHAHVTIWTTMVCLPLAHFGVLAWWHPLFLYVGHYISDYIKCQTPKDPKLWHYIYYDQGWHLLQLAIVWVTSCAG